MGEGQNHMPEQEPVVTLQFEDGEIRMPRTRTTIYTFMGRTAMSHFFITDPEQSNDEVSRGSYVWRDKIGEQGFDRALLHMIRLGFHARLNEPTVPTCDELNYDATHPADSVPDLGVADEVEREMAAATAIIDDDELNRWLNGE